MPKTFTTKQDNACERLDQLQAAKWAKQIAVYRLAGVEPPAALLAAVQ